MVLSSLVPCTSANVVINPKAPVRDPQVSHGELVLTTRSKLAIKYAVGTLQNHTLIPKQLISAGRPRPACSQQRKHAALQERR